MSTATTTAITTTTNKPKIMKTTRILFSNRVLYVSNKIASELREHLIRAENNRMMVKKGEKVLVKSKLRELAQTHPDHFTNEGRIWIIDYHCAGA